MFYLAVTRQKVHNIHRAICFVYYCLRSLLYKSEIQLFRLRIAVNAIFSSLLPKQPRFQSDIPSNRWYTARIFQSWL